MVSEDFNPFHVGHLRMFKAAKALGDELVASSAKLAKNYAKKSGK